MHDSTITISGNLVDYPRHRVLPDGGPSVATFRMASNRRRFDRASGTWIDAEAVFMTVTCWRSLADHVRASLGKGDAAIVTGRLSSNSYVDKDGNARTVLEIDAVNVGAELTWAMATVHRLKRPAAGDVGEAGAATAPPGVDLATGEVLPAYDGEDLAEWDDSDDSAEQMEERAVVAA